MTNPGGYYTPNDITRWMQRTWASTNTQYHTGGSVTGQKSAAFDGFDLAVGEVYGLRLWKIDAYGRLRARNVDGPPWRPGINEAKCLAQSPTPRSVKFEEIIDPSGKGRVVVDITDHRKVPLAQDQFTNFINTFNEHTKRFSITWSDGKTGQYNLDELQFTVPQHQVPVESCQCGFYAYTDPESSEIESYTGNSDYVLGVIRGTGRTLIGTKGFRTELAEIVALRDPTRGGKKMSSWRVRQRDQIARVYPDVPMLASRAELLQFAPIETSLPDPSTDEFWALP